LVFDNPAAASLCAFSLREVGGESVLTSLEFRTDLLPRLTPDFDGLQPVFDAVQPVEKFSGRVMTRASRIEPVTPPGLVYATEASPARLLADAPVACDYAGQVPPAKGFGVLPLYIVRPFQGSRAATSCAAICRAGCHLTGNAARADQIHIPTDAA
jgi:adenylate cyclase